MHVDAMTIAALADEWRALLLGARIDTIIQPTEYAIALQCYAPARPSIEGTASQGGANRWLYLSAHPQLARAHLTTFKPPKIASEPPPFVMLLRKHLEGARIESIVQPRWERVLEIIAGYRRSPESEERTRFRLIVEIMGRLSNIILCNEQGLILGSLKRVGAEVNRYRVIVAGIAYVPPPPQQRMVAGQALARLDPMQVTATQLAMAATEQGVEPSTRKKGKVTAKLPGHPQGMPLQWNEHASQAHPSIVGASLVGALAVEPKLWQLLSRHLAGCSPLLAREAVYRTVQDAEAVVTLADENIWEALAWHVRELASLYESQRWRPQLVERVERGQDASTTTARVTPVAFAPYALEQYAQLADLRVRDMPSINVLLDEYYARAEWRDALETLRAPLRKILQTQRERCLRKASLLQQELATSQEAAQYRLQAELLLAHQNEIQQGEHSVALQNIFEHDSDENYPIVTVPLDPRFDAVGNANRLFNKYHKLRRALTLVPAQIEQNVAELATVEQLLTDVLLAETPAEVALVKAEVQAAGYIRGKAALDKKVLKAAKKGKGGKQGKGKTVPPGGGVPLYLQSGDGFTLLVGKNSRQNEEVTFRQATANDMWLHARGVPGAHVIVKAAGRTIPSSTIAQAASLAAYYSQARGSTSVPVDYTLQRHVRHMKGGGPGMVIYERERTVYAVPDEAVTLLKG